VGVWGVGCVGVYDRNNLKIGTVRHYVEAYWFWIQKVQGQGNRVIISNTKQQRTKLITIFYGYENYVDNINMHYVT